MNAAFRASSMRRRVPPPCTPSRACDASTVASHASFDLANRGPRVRGRAPNCAVSRRVRIAGGLAIIYLTPKAIARVIPSPLVAIGALTAIAIATAAPVRRVGQMGALPESLPSLSFPSVPLSLETLKIVFPHSLTLAMVGLLASLLCASMVDDLDSKAFFGTGTIAMRARRRGAMRSE